MDQKLLALKAKVQDHSHIIDHSFIPKYLKTSEAHDKCYDEDLGPAMRSMIYSLYETSYRLY